MSTKSKVKTTHEKKLELAKASAPQYGIYIDGGSVEKLSECMLVSGPVVLGIVQSESNEATKQMALQLLKDVVPSVNGCNISNVSIDQQKTP